LWKGPDRDQYPEVIHDKKRSSKGSAGSQSSTLCSLAFHLFSGSKRETHIEGDVPIENMLALIETVQEQKRKG